MNIRLFSIAELIAHTRTPLYRNAYALIISTATSSGLGLVYWILAARLYPTEFVGLNAAIVSIMTFLAGVPQLPLMGALTRFVPVAGRASHRLVSGAYLMSSLIVIIVSVAFILGIDLWFPSISHFRSNPWLVLWFILGTIAWCIFALQDNVLTALRKTIYVPIENIAYAIAKIVLLLIFATSFVQYGILASWTIPLLVALAPVNFLIFNRLIPEHMRTTAGQAESILPKDIAKYVIGGYLGSLFVLISSRLLPAIVAREAGVNATAYFYLPWTIALALKVVTANMATSFTVESSLDRTILDKGYHFLKNMMRVLVPLIAVILLGAPFILRFSGSSYAAEGSTLLRLLALSVIPNAVNSLFVGFSYVQHRITIIVMVQGSFCALTICLSYVLLHRYGITGVGIAVLISETIIAVILMLTQLRMITRPVALQRNRNS
jgi:O-antigen/teichoic acid export membrane protein